MENEQRLGVKMLDFIHDEEAVIQDVDVWVAGEIARGNYLARLAQSGVCIHDGVVGLSPSGKIYYPEQHGLVGEQHRCWECGVVFESVSDWVDTCRSL